MDAKDPLCFVWGACPKDEEISKLATFKEENENGNTTVKFWYECSLYDSSNELIRGYHEPPCYKFTEYYRIRFGDAAGDEMQDKVPFEKSQLALNF